MSWLNRLFGIPDPEEREDTAALDDLREAFTRMHRRTDRLEAELRRINESLRKTVDGHEH